MKDYSAAAVLELLTTLHHALLGWILSRKSKPYHQSSWLDFITWKNRFSGVLICADCSEGRAIHFLQHSWICLFRSINQLQTPSKSCRRTQSLSEFAGVTAEFPLPQWLAALCLYCQCNSGEERTRADPSCRLLRTAKNTTTYFKLKNSSNPFISVTQRAKDTYFKNCLLKQETSNCLLNKKE